MYEQRPQKIIDLRLPLTWLIGATVSIVVSMATFYAKVDGMASKQADLQHSIDSLQDKIEKRDETVSGIQNSIMLIQGKNDTQQSQIDRATNDITDMRRDIEDIRKTQRGVLR